MSGQASVQSQQELSAAVQRSLEASVFGGMVVDKSQLWGVPLTRVLCPLLPWVKFKPPQILGTPSQEVLNNRLSWEGARPKDSTCLDFYVPNGKGSRLSQLSPKHSCMLSQACNLFFIIRLHNLMEKYRTPFLEWIGLLVISMPYRQTPWLWYPRGQPSCPR